MLPMGPRCENSTLDLSNRCHLVTLIKKCFREMVGDEKIESASVMSPL